MNEDLIGLIKDYLKYYNESIDSLYKNFDKLEVLGKYSARDSLINKYKISFLIESLEKEGVSLSNLKDEYEKINKKLLSFEQKKGKVYHDKVYKELKYFVDTYYATICFFIELDPVDLELDNDLAGRDTIEILFKELESEYDIHDMKLKVSALDEALKCQFEKKLDYLLKECDLIERPYYPENFWWRHPSKLRAVNK